MNPEHARRMATRALIGLVALGVIYLFFAHTVAGQRFDDAAKLYAVTHQLRFRRLESLASLVVVAAVGMVVVAVCLWARDRIVAAFAWTVVAVVPPWLLAELGKAVLPRPHLHPTPPWIGAASFPSGHVTITASCVLAMVTLAPPALRLRTSALATVTILTSTTLVIVSGMHRPSDVYGAPVLALTWVACLAVPLQPLRRAFGKGTRTWLVGAAIIGVIGFSIGSVSFHSASSGGQNLPAQTVIDHTLWGAVLLGYAIAIAVGALAYELLGSTRTPTTSPITQTAGRPRGGRSPSSDTA